VIPLQQIHFAAPNMSWRGVRLRVLRPSEVAAAVIDASKELPEDQALNSFAHRKKLEPEVARRMLVEYTDPGIPLLQAEGVVWHQTNLAELSMPGTGKSFDALFRRWTRDVELIYAAYERWHQVVPDDVEHVLRESHELESGITEVHFSLPMMSRRVVRLDRLSPSQKADAELIAGKAAIEGFHGFTKAVQFECSKRMVVAYSDEIDPVLPKALEREALDAARLEFEERVKSARWTQAQGIEKWEHFDAIFTARDLAAIDDINKRWHDVRPAEVDAILGKALQVAAPG
jgi:hypothetical protein